MIIFLLCSTGPDLHAQSDQDSVYLPIKKGNWLAVLNGNLSSVNLDRFAGSQSQINLTNEYDFNISSGHFFVDRLAFGITFDASRAETRRISEVITERFSIGPFVRYYLKKNPNGSMFITGGLLYGQITETNRVNIPQSDFEVLLFGKGPGVFGGLGYSHFLTKHIGLDVSLRYDFLYLQTEVHDSSTNTKTIEEITALRSYFGFGFVIIIPEFAF